MPDEKKASILDQFTHEMFVIERDKVPEELRKMSRPGGGVVAWGYWTPEDLKAHSSSPNDVLQALIDAEEEMNWRIIRELIEEMGGECRIED